MGVALRRLGRDKGLLLALGLLVMLVVLSLAAPLWARHVAHTTPAENHLSDTVRVDGEERDVVALDGVPIGPTWSGRFFLGADQNGRDTMVRLLYAGRNSLLIGFGAGAITVVLSTLLGLLAGYLRGWVDSAVAVVLDVVWAFPVILLGVALGVALALGGLRIGPVAIEGDSKLIPVLVIALVSAPYMARPIRGHAMALRERQWVEAARAQGAGPVRIMASEVLPNLLPTIAVFGPLMVANALLLEAGLSFLGAGVRPPEPSWGTMIADGVDLMVSAAHLTLVPGLMLVLCVLALNRLGEGLREAVDPRGVPLPERP